MKTTLDVFALNEELEEHLMHAPVGKTYSLHGMHCHMKSGQDTKFLIKDLLLGQHWYLLSTRLRQMAKVMDSYGKSVVELSGMNRGDMSDPKI